MAALAKELGVTQAKLRAALQKVRGDLVKEHEAERDAFITKLAAKLGVSEAKVKEVIGSQASSWEAWPVANRWSSSSTTRPPSGRPSSARSASRASP